MFKSKSNAVKSPKVPGTKLMIISSVIVAVLGLASLINNILLFKDTVSQYVAQGYPSAEVLKYLIPSQLLPGLFELLAVYGGIAMILWGAAIINQNISNCGYAYHDQDLCVDEAVESDPAELEMENSDLND